jgi:uncharacterized delta-60 repeat protein
MHFDATRHRKTNLTYNPRKKHHPHANQPIMKNLFQISASLLFSAALWMPPGGVSAQSFTEIEFSNTGGNAYVYATVLQADGIVAVGAFNSVWGTTRNNIARLTNTGALDSSFNPNANGLINHALVQNDGKILIIGGFTSVGGYSRNYFARLNSDGTVDTSFAPTFSGGGAGVAALQADGKILLGGTFTSVNGTGRNRIARLNSDGTLDSSFNPNANGQVKYLSIQPDGKILAIGLFGTIGGGTKVYFARLNSDGTLDTSFTSGGTTGDYITSCPIFGADGSIIYPIQVGLGNGKVEKITSSGTYVGYITDFSDTSNEIYEIIGTEALFHMPLTSGSIYSQSSSSGSSWTNLGYPVTQISQMLNGGLIYGREQSGPSLVGTHGVPNTTPTESLTYVSGTTLRWMQSVSFPGFDHTEFQLSTDGGSTWTALGFGTRISESQIELTGITLPSSGLVRAVSGTRSGVGGVSRSLILSKVVSVGAEIDLTGNSQSILDGDTTPILADGTDFGSKTASSGTQVRSFTISNPSVAALNISSVSISGTHATDFSISSSPSSSVPAQQTTTFSVTFDPSGLGTRSATITIASNDSDEGSFEFDVQGTGIEPEINLKGNGASIVDGDASPSLSDHTDFGSVVWNQPLVRTFTIENTGVDPLSISSITRTGDTANFTISGITVPVSVAASSSETFTVTFNPGASVGSKSATVLVTSNDGDEASYDFAVQGVGVAPEMDVLGNSVSIADGDTTPSTTDHTDFGSPSGGGVVVRTYTVQNTGSSSLTISAINLSGHTSDFTVGGISLPVVVAASGSTTFTLTFAPLTSGLRSATVSLVNDDQNEGPYDFAVQGTSAPEINVQGGGSSIVDGDTTPSMSDETDFGAAITGAEQVISSFTIQNLGNGPLSISVITKGGSHSGDFTVSGLSLPASIPSGGNTSFNVTFAPSAVGTRSASITISNNDGNESNYDFAIQGRGVEAGELDTLFNPNASAVVNAAAVQPDGRIILAGNFTTMGGTARDRVARVNQDGTLDTSFIDPNIPAEVNCVAIQADGKILIGGSFTTINSVARNRVARLNADGSLDTSYNPNANGIVHGIAIQSDGKAIVTGAFTTIAGQARNRIAKLNSDGTATTFNPNANSTVHGSVTQSDGKVILYGIFTTVGGTARTRIARVDSAGALDTGYSPNANSTVDCAVLQPDGKLVIGGLFTTVAGVTRNRLARLETNGAADTGFTPVANAEVHGLSLQANGKLVVNGQLTLLNSVAREYAGRLNADGTLDTSFINRDLSSLGYVYGTALDADGRLLMTGAFTTVAGTARNRVARLENDVATETLAVASSSRIEWLRGGAGPEASFVTFELSTDGGSTWSVLGSGTRITSGWEITGLSLPGTGQIRASAVTSGGRKNSSQGIVQSQTDF